MPSGASTSSSMRISTSGSCSESYSPSDSVESVSSSKILTQRAMLPCLDIPALVSPLCPSLPHTFPTATAEQRHERYHLPLGIVLQHHSLYHFPSLSLPLLHSPSPSTSLSLTPSHRLFPSLSRSHSHWPACAPHPRHCHCHCHRYDGSIPRLAVWDRPSCHHHHPRRLS